MGYAPSGTARSRSRSLSLVEYTSKLSPPLLELSLRTIFIVPERERESERVSESVCNLMMNVYRDVLQDIGGYLTDKVS